MTAAVKAALKAWGDATVNRYAYSKADRSTHQIAQAMEVAPGTVERARKQLEGRDGRGRRLYMAASMQAADIDLDGVKRFRIVPTWACDPIPCHDDADRPHDNAEIAFDMGIPDDLRWVESAVASLMRLNQTQARVLEVEFTMAASHKTKARILTERHGETVTVDMYRKELSKALMWMDAKRA